MKKSTQFNLVQENLTTLSDSLKRDVIKEIKAIVSGFPNASVTLKPKITLVFNNGFGARAVSKLELVDDTLILHRIVKYKLEDFSTRTCLLLLEAVEKHDSERFLDDLNSLGLVDEGEDGEVQSIMYMIATQAE